MAAEVSKYGLTTFSPSGDLVQIQYAQAAVDKGAASLGMKAVDGCVVAAEKKMPSPLIDPSSIQKVFQLDDHAGCTYSGVGPDSRVLIDEARKACQVYRLRYNEPMPIGQLVRELASIIQEFTQSGGVRPFGVCLLVAGADNTGNHLYQVDPAGTYVPWRAVAAGRKHSEASGTLQKRYAKTMEIEDAVNTTLHALKGVMDGKMTPENTEVGRVTNGKFEVLGAAALQDYIDQI
jgi:20S proteasome subunit alpha 2